MNTSDEVSDSELHSFGYAPGSYVSKCLECEAEIWHVDKRCHVCRSCALKRRAKAMSESGTVSSNDRARLLIALLRNGVSCNSLHHTFKDRHASGEDCPVLARIDAELSELFPEKEGPSTCEQEGHGWETVCRDCGSVRDQHETCLSPWKRFCDEAPVNDGRTIWWDYGNGGKPQLAKARDFGRDDGGYWAELEPPRPTKETEGRLDPNRQWEADLEDRHAAKAGAPFCRCIGEECHGSAKAADYGYRCRNSL